MFGMLEVLRSRNCVVAQLFPSEVSVVQNLRMFKFLADPTFENYRLMVQGLTIWVRKAWHVSEP